jgi:hypothetical protein
MKISPDEKKFIEGLSNISGVSKEDINKVFSSFILYIVLELYEKLDEYYDDNVLINEEINIKLPYVLDNLKIILKEKEAIGGIAFDLLFEGEAHEYLIENIHQMLCNATPDIQEKLKLEIFEGLENLSK